MQTLRAAIDEWVADPTVAGNKTVWVWLASRLRTRQPGWVVSLVKTLVSDNENARFALSRHHLPTPAVIDEEDGGDADGDDADADVGSPEGGGVAPTPSATPHELPTDEATGDAPELPTEEAAGPYQRINDAQLAHGLNESLQDGGATRGGETPHFHTVSNLASEHELVRC